jgi:hypothetical protein
MLGAMCMEFQDAKILSPFGGLCCVGFINITGGVFLLAVSEDRDQLFLLGPPE